MSGRRLRCRFGGAERLRCSTPNEVDAETAGRCCSATSAIYGSLRHSLMRKRMTRSNSSLTKCHVIQYFASPRFGDRLRIVLRTPP